MAPNVLFSSTVAAAIPSPLHRILSPCPWWLWNVVFIWGRLLFSSLFVKCGVNLRAATKRGAACIRANTVHSSPGSSRRFGQNCFITVEQHCLKQAASGSSKIGRVKWRQYEKTVLYGPLWWIVRIFSSLYARARLIELAFSCPIQMQDSGSTADTS